MFFKKILSFLVLLGILTGCSSTNDHIETDKTRNTETVSERAIESAHEMPQKTSTVPMERNTGKINQTTGRQTNQEPNSPLVSINLSQASQDLSGKKISTFFDFFGKKPIYYQFATKLQNHSYQSIIAQDEQGHTYLKITRGEDSFEIVSDTDDKYFLLDEAEQIANEIDREKIANQILYLESFSEMNEFAQHLYYIGSGKAIFYGQQVVFEEYTKDNETFIRYYFDQETCLGFRVFAEQKMQVETKIISLDNQIPEEAHLFEIPEHYKVIKAEDELNSKSSEITSDETVIQETGTLAP